MRLAILSNVSTQYLTKSIFNSLNGGVSDLEIYEVPFATWKMGARGFDKNLQDFKPDAILLFLSSTSVSPGKLCNLEFETDVKEAIDAAKHWFTGKLYVTSLDYCDAALTSSDAKMSIDRLNINLFEMSKTNSLIFIDLFSIIHAESYEKFSPGKYHGIGCFSLHPKFYDQVSKRISGVIKATVQRPIKIIFVDLDNTLWPGILGDDGIHNINLAPDTAAAPHLSLQYLLKRLRDNGVLLAICSKNNLDTVEKFFQLREHEMELGWGDFAAIKANWQPKSKNIIETLDELNLTTNGVVFIDDSPFERNEVKSVLPEVGVLELPIETYVWSKFLSETELFHTPIVTNEDIERTNFYKNERERLNVKKSMSQDDYLQSLQLKITARAVTNSNIDRIVQLINKTNQFNTTGVKVDHETLHSFLDKENHFLWAFELQDVYSNYGIISCIFGSIESQSQIQIDGWVISCRAFTRNIETAILQFLANRFNYCTEAQIHFKETKKNRYAQKYFNDTGFSATDNNKNESIVFHKTLRDVLDIKTHVHIS
jgi:FkbH-like protein